MEQAFDDDEETTLCDKCGCEVPEAETQNGPEGTEWETCTLCNDCYAEEQE